MRDAWWKQKACEIQAASDVKNAGLLYKLLRDVYGPTASMIAPVKSKDGKEMHCGSVAILNRWREHFECLLNQPTEVDPAVLNSISSRSVMLTLDEPPSLDEVKLAIRKLKNRRAPGADGINAELIMCGSGRVCIQMHALFCTIWETETIPEDWRDALMVVLYKGKGSKADCGNWRGISLLSVDGKALGRIILDHLIKLVAAYDVLPETRCGFRSGRSTTDMVFTVRQLQEKCIEQQVGLSKVFVDLEKAFDSMNRVVLWEILRKLGCPQGL